MEYPPVSVVMPVRNEERRGTARRPCGTCSRRITRARWRSCSPSGPRTTGPSRWRELGAEGHGHRQPQRADSFGPERRSPGGPVRHHRPGRRPRAAAARVPQNRGRRADGHRSGRRRRNHGRRGRDRVPAGGGLGHDVANRQASARPRSTPAATPGPADSVYLGVYRREAIEEAGGYDNEMLRAEDWELNYRIRARGHLIWFTPELRITYRPRASVGALGSGAAHYGRWRRVIVREHPETANFRYLAPPGAAALVAVGLLAGLAGLIGIAAGAPAEVSWLAAGFVIPLTYLLGITAVSAALSRGSRQACEPGCRSSSPRCTWPGGPGS